MDLTGLDLKTRLPDDKADIDVGMAVIVRTDGRLEEYHIVSERPVRLNDGTWQLRVHGITEPIPVARVRKPMADVDGYPIERIRLKAGDPVAQTLPDGEIRETTVSHPPIRLSDGTWVVYLTGTDGAVDLSLVQPPAITWTYSVGDPRVGCKPAGDPGIPYAPRPKPASKRRKSAPGKFWLVWSPQGGPPVQKITNFAAARGVAKKLGKKVPDRDFFVLESVWGKARPATPAGSKEGGTP